MSIIQLLLAIAGIVLVIFGVIDLVNAAYVAGAILTVVGVILLSLSRGGLNLTL
jgi:uncharacterized membrane protein